MVEDIYNFVDTEIGDIKAKTDTLPSDPADQSEVEDAISEAVSDIGTATGVETEVSVDPADGTTSFTTVIAADSGKTFSGRIGGIVNGDPANLFRVLCGTPGGSAILLLGPVPALTNVNEEFVCTYLELAVDDPSGGGDAIAVLLDLTTQYETAEVSWYGLLAPFFLFLSGQRWGREGGPLRDYERIRHLELSTYRTGVVTLQSSCRLSRRTSPTE
ncbi:MAG: hypothetical protein ACREBU_05320 [Nitrososphaera sp.]